MMISLSVKEIEEIKDLLETNVRKIHDDIKKQDVHREVSETLLEPIEEKKKLIAYLDSKLPERY